MNVSAWHSNRQTDPHISCSSFRSQNFSHYNRAVDRHLELIGDSRSRWSYFPVAAEEVHEWKETLWGAWFKRINNDTLRSKYAWWVPLVPTFFIAVLIAWHLWMSYFQLSHVSRSSLLGLFSLFMTVIISDMSKWQHVWGDHAFKLIHTRVL